MARSRDVTAQRERLSSATWSVLAERGPEGLTLRAVAERAGCTTGLVLHTFPTKQALLVHARQLLHERTGERADAAEAAGDPLAALTAVLHEAASLTDTKREEARVWLGFLAAALADADLAALHRRYNRAFVARIERLVAACRPDRPAERVALDARRLVALVEGFNALTVVDPQTYDPAVQRAALAAELRALAD